MGTLNCWNQHPVSRRSFTNGDMPYCASGEQTCASSITVTPSTGKSVGVIVEGIQRNGEESKMGRGKIKARKGLFHWLLCHCLRLTFSGSLGLAASKLLAQV